MTDFELVAPHPRYRASFLAALAELPASEAGQLIYTGADSAAVRADFDGYAAELARRETHPPAPLVPDSIRWAVRGEEFLGRICLRHRLTDRLERFGGHIGFAVRPSARRRALASAMLARTLRGERARAIGALLLTCDPDNLASRRTIERNGGVLLDEVAGPEERERTQRYWIRPQALLVRHCEAVGQGPDAPLTPEGRAQAERLAGLLARHEFHTVRSSPYRRALDSIGPFAKVSGAHVEEDAALGLGAGAAEPAELLTNLLACPGNTLAATHGPVVGRVLDALGERRWGTIGNPDVFSLRRTAAGGIEVRRLGPAE